MFNGVPCCIPRAGFRVTPLTDDVNHWQTVWKTKNKKDMINCPETFGLAVNGENACFLREYDATCDGMFFTALMKPLTNIF